MSGVDRVVYCPGCGGRMRREASRDHRWFCDNLECDVIELTYKWDYLSITEIKQVAAPRPKATRIY